MKEAAAAASASASASASDNGTDTSTARRTLKPEAALGMETDATETLTPMHKPPSPAATAHLPILKEEEEEVGDQVQASSMMARSHSTKSIGFDDPDAEASSMMARTHSTKSIGFDDPDDTHMVRTTSVRDRYRRMSAGFNEMNIDIGFGDGGEDDGVGAFSSSDDGVGF
jgi:hypothetical protein